MISLEPVEPQDDAPHTETEESVVGQASYGEGNHTGHYLPPPTLWERFTGWRGSFLVLSILCC